jgi:hypothetical protein
MKTQDPNELLDNSSSEAKALFYSEFLAWISDFAFLASPNMLSSLKCRWEPRIKHEGYVDTMST